MRCIINNESPQALLAWKAQRNNAKPRQVSDFRQLGRIEIEGDSVDVKQAIKEQRLIDQGGLCAYTMMRIRLDTSHVEHLKPQTLSRENDRVGHFIEETVDYGNMALCYPKKEGSGGVGYGAPYRGEANLVLTPRDARCERLIQYHRDGSVDSEDTRVDEMLSKVLNLNHATLVDRRKESYNRAGVGLRPSNLLSEKEASRLAESVLKMNAKNELAPFCAGISHAAKQHVEILQKRRRKKAMARRGN